MDSDNKLYAVIIGDVSGSKQLSGRNRYQTQLFMKSAIVQINEEFHEHIEAPLTITKGDEFQGLLTNLEAAFRIVLALEKLTFPTRLRFGIGIGNVYKMGGRLPIEMDGPAFHFAREAINRAKNEQRNLCYASATPDARLIDQILKWMDLTTSKWKSEKMQTIVLHRLGYSQKQMEKEIGISQSAISQNLKSENVKAVMQSEQLVENYLKTLLAAK